MTFGCYRPQNEANESGQTALFVDARREVLGPLCWRE